VVATFPAGAHTVSLTVTGPGGTLNQQHSYLVDAPPVADFSPPAAPVAGQPLKFTSTSTDADGDALTYAWTVDGVAAGATANLTTTLAAGSHTVVLTVNDGKAPAVAKSRTVSVDAPPNVPKFTVSPAAPVADETVTLTASATDPDGKIASYSWDLNGDGTYGDASGESVFTSFTTGTHTVGLKVTDDDGASATTTQAVKVVDPPAPSSGSSTTSGGSGGQVGTASTPKGSSKKKAAAKPTSPALLKPFPVIRYAGRLTSVGAQISLLSVQAPKGARVHVSCVKGCPRRSLALVARALKLSKLQGTYRAGAVLEITVTKPKTIGKFTRITIRDGKAPRRVDRCLWPGKKTPRTCPVAARKTAKAAAASRSAPASGLPWARP
jgi:hypothetical protein